MLELSQFFVFGLGAVAVAQAIWFIRFFRGNDSNLSWAMIAFLTEQIISAVGTMAFSVNSLIATITGAPVGEWNSFPAGLAQFIRAAMFIGMIHATGRLAYAVKKIKEES